MKKINKNFLFSIGTLGATITPIATIVACNDSKKGIETNNTGTPGNVVLGSSNIGSVTALGKAWDTVTQTIDLAQVKDQFEFVSILSEATALKNLKALSKGFEVTTIETDRTHLHTLWDEVKNKFETLLSTRPKEADITIKFGNDSVKFNLGIYTLINNLIKAIPIGDTETAAAAAVKSGLPDGEIGAGAPILTGQNSQLLIQSLLAVNTNLAMSGLMKLTHLPTDAFEQFKGLVNNIQGAFSQLTTSQAYQSWVTNKNVKIDVQVDGITKYGTSLISSNIQMILGAHFLVETLDV